MYFTEDITGAFSIYNKTEKAMQQLRIQMKYLTQVNKRLMNNNSKLTEVTNQLEQKIDKLMSNLTDLKQNMEKEITELQVYN